MDYKNMDFHSDDDFDCSNGGFSDSYNGTNGSGQGQNSNPNGLSKAELRKTNKPIMEKRRRARINHCLNELKSLILEAMKKDPARHTKLEKADILEMTVKHLQSVQRQQLSMAIQTDPTVVHKFKTGFIECAEEVNRYINQLDGVDAMVRQRLTSHLSNCATNLEQLGSMTNFNNGYCGQLAMGAISAPGKLFGNALAGNALTMVGGGASGALFPTLPQDFNNNSSSSSSVFGSNLGVAAPVIPPIQMGGVQLIPSRLPSGEFALIMPTSAHVNVLNNNNNTNATFANYALGRSAATATSPVANTPVATVATAVTAPTQLPATSVPINDFAANYKCLSAFSRPPAAPTQTLVNALTPTNAASGKTTHLSSNFSSSCIAATQQQQQPRAAPAHQLHHQSSTATNSPPLSPISSVSSQCEDSLMHTSSDFTGSRPATPPLDVTGDHQHNFSGVFSTPSSAESSLLTCSTSSQASIVNHSVTKLSTHLQQQQVSSTSGNVSGKSCNTSTSSLSSGNNHNNDCSDSGVEMNGSLKRSLDDDEADSSDACETPPSKKVALESKPLVEPAASEAALRKQKHRLHELKEDTDNMWRPW